ncbi:MAG: hypothetical protein R3F56_06555 [Planctomycetota bacterium]
MAKTKRTPVAVPEEVADKKGMSFEDGIVLSTTLVLLIALVLAWLQYSSFYGS